MSTKIPIKILILAGGQSSRMGKPKHLLEIEGVPLYIRLLHILAQACKEAQGFYMSMKDPSSLLDPEAQVQNATRPKVAFDFIFDEYNNIGPAGGLLAAYSSDSTCRWLVVACDFPLLRVPDISQLIKAYQDPVTCFKNAEGWTEPLLAIWSPEALRILQENVKAGQTGPNHVIKSLNSTIIEPIDQIAMFNANTPEEWQHALNIAKGQHSHREGNN